MTYQRTEVAADLCSWQTYLGNYQLPAWDLIPDLGLYMEQVTLLMQQYLTYLPTDNKDEQAVTAASINNYVRLKMMPEPMKKRYYRPHIAYLIMICTLKQSLPLAGLKAMIPADLSENELKDFYQNYVAQHKQACLQFNSLIDEAAAPLLDDANTTEDVTAEVNQLIVSNALCAGFSRLLSERLQRLAHDDLSTNGPEENKNK